LLKEKELDCTLRIGGKFGHPHGNKICALGGFFMKRARIVSMIVLAASVVLTAAMAVENLVLACLDLARRRH
jgi:hypothetical protein